MTKTETIEQIIRESKKQGDAEVFDKLSDMSHKLLTKILKVIKGL